MTLPASTEPYDGRYCGAKTRAGTPCHSRAGWGTDHVGVGRCKLHGGKTPIRSGRTSLVYRASLGEAIARFEADPDPLNLSTELATLRALTERYIVRYEEYREQLDEWYADKISDNPTGKPPRPPRLLDLEDARVLLNDVGVMVARIEKIRSENAISRPELFRLMGEMGRVVSRKCDESTAKQIAEEWGTIRLSE